MVVSTGRLPLAVAPSAANIPGSRRFPPPLRLAQVVGAAIARLCADAADDGADNRGLCLQDGIQPPIRQVGEPHV